MIVRAMLYSSLVVMFRWVPLASYGIFKNLSYALQSPRVNQPCLMHSARRLSISIQRFS